MVHESSKTKGARNNHNNNNNKLYRQVNSHNSRELLITEAAKHHRLRGKTHQSKLPHTSKLQQTWCQQFTLCFR